MQLKSNNVINKVYEGPLKTDSQDACLDFYVM